MSDEDKIVFELKRVPVSFFRFDPPKPPKNRVKAWLWHRRREWRLARHMRFNSIPPTWANRVVNAQDHYWYRPKYWTLHKLGRHTRYCEQVFGCHKRRRSLAGDDETIPMASASG